MDVSSVLTGMKNETEQVQAATRVTGSTELSQDAFLQLLMTQLQNQDPLEPMSNEQFLSQQAQFTQISELQKLNKAVDNSNQMMQASSLIGKTVTLSDPDNPVNTIQGTVSEAKFTSNNASIVINGQEYSMDDILSIKNG